MSNVFTNLKKILELESQRGYQNDAVVGGLECYAEQWQSLAIAAVSGREQIRRVEQIIDALMGYSLLPVGARRSTIRSIQERLDSLSEDSAKSKKKASKKRKLEAAQAAELGRAPHPRSQAPSFTVSPLAAPLTSLSGIGPKLSGTLARLNLNEIGDLLWHLPYRYQDYSNLQPISALKIGEEVTIRATVWGVSTRRIKGNRKLSTAVLIDGTGKINATFWNPHIDKYLLAEKTYFFSGKISSYMGKRTLESPEFEAVSEDPTHTARIVPVYPLTEGLSSRVLRKHIRQVVDTWTEKLPDPLPASLRQRLGYPGVGNALQQVHFPDSVDKLDKARKRLAFDELLVIQLGVLGQRRAWQNKPAQPLAFNNDQRRTFLKTLPFALTQAQRRVLADVDHDSAHDYPMTRLLQGDVGSGKTVIAAAAMWNAVCNGAQAALMAPTEILAEQHHRNLYEQFAQLTHPVYGRPLQVTLLTGSVTGKKREALLHALVTGDIDILIGTHALIQEHVHFHDLALIIVDEQHRFGVNQRSALREKGAELNLPDEAGICKTPHTLVMSATPIPRTLALTIYGDMDVSAIDELPPGRQPIKTYWIKPDVRPRVYNFIRKQVVEGRQVFVIYPLVEESDRLEDVGAAIAEHKRLQTKVFSDLRVGLLHGRLTGKQKDEIMLAFAAGDFDILVSTAVVEVGIDIANASVILIENAERFGLAQLHQFRGRVGRGPHQSYCILVSDPNSDHGIERMRSMERTQDGFELAEVDLRMRGPGEFFGSRQSGLPDLKLARMSDARLLELARNEAKDLLDADPHLSRPDHLLLSQRLSEYWSQELDLS